MIAATGAIPRLVQLLGPGVPPAVQYGSAAVLMNLAAIADLRETIADAGAIPPLVRLLVGDRAEPAAGALANLCGTPMNVDIQAAIAAAGAIPRLVQLMLPGTPADTRVAAATALRKLRHNNAANQAAQAVATRACADRVAATMMQQLRSTG
jgi:hypothetical protein